MNITLITPEDRDRLTAILGTRPEAGPALPLDAAEVHRDTISGRYTTEALGRYCRTALPLLLGRLLAVEQLLTTTRHVLADHVAAVDGGDDRDLSDLLRELETAGVGLTDADIEAAAAISAAEAHAGAFG
ncbi:hypothetical protein ACFQ61_01990 [Streptomyces sp. NPDC056500]|uniref:hypothetical protein n=1 Tax=Streptomyces sp. NPDC056500 TaxID=3345840 RepID=UPI003679A8CF